jgi:hypothetical protein
MPKRKYTQAEWARLQARFPEEDRVPYSQSPMVPTMEESLTALTTSVQESKTSVTKAEEDIKAAETDKITALQAQVDAARNAALVASQTGAKVDPNTGLLTPPTTVSKVVPGSKKEIRREMIGSGLSRILRIYYDDGTSQDFSAAETPIDNPIIPPSSDPAMIALIQSLQNQIASLTANNSQAAIDKAAADAAAKKEKAESAIAVLTDRFSRYGLASLVPKIRELAIGGAGESTITLQLQETEEYRQRFRANQDRIKKGLSVLDPGDYLGLEDDYRQILRAYGLKQFDNDDYVTQFISNDISTTELSNRVSTAVQRVQNADPAILTTLRSFYGISDNDLVAYVLDPNQQFQKIERQVAAAEIGAAAKLQGINAGVTVSEQLAAQGVTKAQAQKGYATIADILPTAEKLSDIYGKTLDEYRLGEAEQEVFNTLASAQRKRQKLIQTEIASFSGASGLGKSSLSSQLGGTY